MSGGITAGEVVEIPEKTRREVLGGLAAGGAGAIGLSDAVRAATGKEPEGKTIVWTRDKYGRPKRTRVIPEERYRRIKVFSNFDAYGCKKENPQIKGMGLVQQSDDPSDLAIEIKLETNNRSNRREIPDEIQGVPITYSEDNSKYEPILCDENVGPAHDPIEGNVEIYGKDSDGGNQSSGTLTFVAWNAGEGGDPSDDIPVLLTAAHVAVEDGYTSPHLYMADYDEVKEFAVGSDMMISEWCPGMDAAKYEIITDDLGYYPLATYSDDVPDVEGYWEFDGLTDATTGSGSVETHFSGRMTCYSNDNCVETEQCRGVEYAAVVDNVMENGDSGGPFVDNHGDFVGTAVAKTSETTTLSVGAEFLDSVHAQLTPPSVH